MRENQIWHRKEIFEIYAWK